MGIRGLIEVTKHFPDGHTEVQTTQLLPEFTTPDDIPHFVVDQEEYYWPRGEKSGVEVLYRPAPSRHPYHKMTAKAVKKVETIPLVPTGPEPADFDADSLMESEIKCEI